jgi:glutathione S-transferase
VKLLTSPASPFSLKVLIAAHELGLADSVEPVDAHVRPYERNREILNLNPLAQVPTLILDDGRTLHDSRVICEFLNELGGGELFPVPGAARWRALTEQSISDGILAAALIARYERAARPPEMRWDAWLNGHIDKILTGLSYVEAHIPDDDRIDIGTISLACAIAYVDFRFPDLNRKQTFPALDRWYAIIRERPSLRAKQLA